MKDIDKKYLLLQFWDKVYQKSAAEFQSFFEDIMQKAYPSFQKIRPYGKEGDKGNDGYRPDKGIYYLVYSPRNPNEKETEAAQKFKNDFEKLKNSWDQITKINEVNFVFNDKGGGISIELEKAAGDLKRDNKNIEFIIFTSQHLVQIFLNLSIDQISSLGFDVDLRNALRIAHEYINKLESELDKDNMDYVSQTLTNIKDLIVEQGDEGLTLEYELMEARTLQKAEKVIEAREKYEGIFKRYPNDPRALLYLAEIYIHNEDFDKNKELLVKAEDVDQNHWLLHVEKLIRDMQLGSEIDPAAIDE
jgi:tetratricopeptide (TPR) repeat protein